MSETGFTPLHKIMLEKSTAEIADRIEQGELYWLDDFGRYVKAENIEKERVLESLRLHFGMSRLSVELEPAHIAEFTSLWNQVEGHIRQSHPLVRGGFLDASSAVLAKHSETGRHISTKLETLNKAAAKFWANADPDDRATHPDNSQVEEWLVSRDFTQTLAAKSATIIRPSWARTGRKPEEQ